MGQVVGIASSACFICMVIDAFFATIMVDESDQPKYKSKTSFIKQRNNEWKELCYTQGQHAWLTIIQAYDIAHP